MPHSVLPVPFRFIAVCPEDEAGDPGRGLGHQVADGFRVGVLVGFDDELVVDVAADAGVAEGAHQSS